MDKMALEHPERAKCAHIFNTFFFTKLTNQNQTDPPLGENLIAHNYPDLTDWVRIDIFAKKYLIVPVHDVYVDD